MTPADVLVLIADALREQYQITMDGTVDDPVVSLTFGNGQCFAITATEITPEITPEAQA